MLTIFKIAPFNDYYTHYEQAKNIFSYLCNIECSAVSIEKPMG